MSLLSDLRILFHMAVKPIRGKNHAERLESFYAGQAEGYDDFRKRLLKGREEMYAAIEPPPGAVWVDMGGGTGANLEFLGDRVKSLGHIYLVDLSPSLLEIADRRIEQKGWENVTTVEADAAKYAPPEGAADVVTFSYSLTMIPDWFAAIDNARRILKPGGLLGVVDFYVSRKYPRREHIRHGWLTRHFWPVWFSSDNVHPSPDHVPYLHSRFTPRLLEEHRARVPYLFFMRTPYYVFVGQRPDG